MSDDWKLIVDLYDILDDGTIQLDQIGKRIAEVVATSGWLEIASSPELLTDWISTLRSVGGDFDLIDSYLATLFALGLNDDVWVNMSMPINRELTG